MLDAALLSRTLQDIFRTHGFASRRVATALTGQNILLRTVNLPAMPKKEVPEAVKWQFDEAVSDYQIISGEMGSPLSVMLVAMQKAPVVTMANTLREAGLTPLVVDIEPLTAFRAVSFGCDRSIVQGLTAVFDFGAGTTNVSIFKNGILQVARVIHFGGRNFTHALMDSFEWGFEQAENEKKKHGLKVDSPIADVMSPLRDELFLELSRTVNFYLADNRAETLANVYMLGGGSLLHQLGPQLRSYLREYINSLDEDLEVSHCSPLGHLNLVLPKDKPLPEGVKGERAESLLQQLASLVGRPQDAKPTDAPTVAAFSPIGLVLGVAVGMALGEVARSES